MDAGLPIVRVEGDQGVRLEPVLRSTLEAVSLAEANGAESLLNPRRQVGVGHAHDEVPGAESAHGPVRQHDHGYEAGEDDQAQPRRQEGHQYHQEKALHGAPRYPHEKIQDAADLAGVDLDAKDGIARAMVAVVLQRHALPTIRQGKAQVLFDVLQEPGAVVLDEGGDEEERHQDREFDQYHLPDEDHPLPLREFRGDFAGHRRFAEEFGPAGVERVGLQNGLVDHVRHHQPQDEKEDALNRHEAVPVDHVRRQANAAAKARVACRAVNAELQNPSQHARAGDGSRIPAVCGSLDVGGCHRVGGHTEDEQGEGEGLLDFATGEGHGPCAQRHGQNGGIEEIEGVGERRGNETQVGTADGDGRYQGRNVAESIAPPRNGFGQAVLDALAGYPPATVDLRPDVRPGAQQQKENRLDAAPIVGYPQIAIRRDRVTLAEVRQRLRQRRVTAMVIRFQQ